jgi:uncharacterized protein YdaU (DUF1376 family)
MNARRSSMRTKTNLHDAPYFPFYVKEWLVGNALLTAEQRGALINLLAHAWVATPPCTLPDDDTQLALLAGIPLKRWRRMADTIRAVFYREDGRLVDGKLLQRHQEMVDGSQRRTAAAQRASQARWGSAPKAGESASAAYAGTDVRRTSRRGRSAAAMRSHSDTD